MRPLHCCACGCSCGAQPLATHRTATGCAGPRLRACRASRRAPRRCRRRRRRHAPWASWPAHMRGSGASSSIEGAMGAARSPLRHPLPLTLRLRAPASAACTSSSLSLAAGSSLSQPSSLCGGAKAGLGWGAIWRLSSTSKAAGRPPPRRPPAPHSRLGLLEACAEAGAARRQGRHGAAAGRAARARALPLRLRVCDAQSPRLKGAWALVASVGYAVLGTNTKLIGMAGARCRTKAKGPASPLAARRARCACCAPPGRLLARPPPHCSPRLFPAPYDEAADSRHATATSPARPRLQRSRTTDSPPSFPICSTPVPSQWRPTPQAPA